MELIKRTQYLKQDVKPYRASGQVVDDFNKDIQDRWVSDGVVCYSPSHAKKINIKTNDVRDLQQSVDYVLSNSKLEPILDWTRYSSDYGDKFKIKTGSLGTHGSRAFYFVRELKRFLNTLKGEYELYVAHKSGNDNVDQPLPLVAKKGQEVIGLLMNCKPEYPKDDDLPF